VAATQTRQAQLARLAPRARRSRISWWRYPRTAAAFTKAVEQGNAIAASNHAVLAQVLATALHLSPKISGVMATGTFPTSANPAQIQRVANLMLQYGQLKQSLNVKQMIEG
jgi:NitT/TauT family transport system substrate-binding protein